LKVVLFHKKNYWFLFCHCITDFNKAIRSFPSKVSYDNFGKVNVIEYIDIDILSRFFEFLKYWFKPYITRSFLIDLYYLLMRLYHLWVIYWLPLFIHRLAGCDNEPDPRSHQPLLKMLSSLDCKKMKSFFLIYGNISRSIQSIYLFFDSLFREVGIRMNTTSTECTRAIYFSNNDLACKFAFFHF